MKATRRRTGRTLGTRLFFSAVVLGLFLAAMEVAGRLLVVLPPEDPARLAENQLPFDPQLGWALPRSSTFMWLGLPVTTNSLGLRGHEPTGGEAGAVGAGPGALPWRLLMLGDSTVFGHGVMDGDTMPQRLEDLLGRYRGVDVQNGGVPGYTCSQSRRLARRVAVDFKPDLLLVYSMHSDRREELTSDRNYLGSGLGLLGRSGALRLAQLLAHRLRSSRGWPVTPVSRYESCLRDTWEEQQARGGACVFIIPLVREDLVPGPSAPETGVRGTRLVDYRQAMTRVSRETGSILVDLPGAFRREGLGADAVLMDEVHLNPVGQLVAAEAIKDVLEQKGLI